MKKNKKLKCPICGKQILKTKEYVPFCSKKCGDIDLLKWLNGKYFVTEDKGI